MAGGAVTLRRGRRDVDVHHRAAELHGHGKKSVGLGPRLAGRALEDLAEPLVERPHEGLSDRAVVLVVDSVEVLVAASESQHHQEEVDHVSSAF